MHLLVENRLADFHSLVHNTGTAAQHWIVSHEPLCFSCCDATQLEVLDDAELKHECVLFPVSLDEALMEGRYNKVLYVRVCAVARLQY